MTEFFAIFIGAVLVQNIVLVSFLGICPLLGVSKKTNAALAMGLAVAFVTITSSAITWGIYYGVLVPFELEFMRTIVFILLIATLVQFVEMVMKKHMTTLYKTLGVYLPLITTNCAVLGASLLNISRGLGFGAAMVNSLGISVGFLLVIYIFATLRERLLAADVPIGFKGVPIALITVALMSMAFIGFVGIGQ